MKNKALVVLLCFVGVFLIVQNIQLARINDQTRRRLTVLERLQASAFGAMRPQTPPRDFFATREQDSIDDVELALRRMNRMFKNVADDVARTWPETLEPKNGAFVLAFDVVETADSYVVRADIPGARKEEIVIEAKGNLLTISGERKSEQETNQKGYYSQERSYGAFSKTISLPEEIKKDQIKAEYKNGVLLVKIPKAKPAKEEKAKIDIQ